MYTSPISPTTPYTTLLLFRVGVFSTNYRRTQLSAQGFLEGFLGGKGGVDVVVRPRAEDFLNQWESPGHEMYEVCLLTGRFSCGFRRFGSCFDAVRGLCVSHAPQER